MSRVWTVLAMLLGLAVLLTGCVVVPTDGPIERVEGGQPGCQSCINIDVDPPTPGAEPLEIVQGFLRASSNYQPNYAVAREYLTESAAGRWSPEAGVSIYSGDAVVRDDESVGFDGRLVGTLAADRSYASADRALAVDFGLVEEAPGEWRINTPPAGLMVSEYSFGLFYRPYDVYFVGNGRTLVPDRIYLPNLPGEPSLASALVKVLLTGPSRWLAPSVTSAVPLNTALSGDSVRIDDGVAEVPLTGEVAATDDQQTSLLAAQVALTLRAATTVTGVRFTVDGRPLTVAGADPDTQVLGVNAVPLGLEPVPYVAAEQLYAVRGRAVAQVNAAAGTPEVTGLPGAFGSGKLTPDEIAASVSGTDLALVTDGRTVLRRGPTTGEGPRTLITGATGLLRPQFSRYEELWAVGTVKGRQQMWVFIGNRRVAVDADFLATGRVTAFKISPDGTRMAAIRQVGGRTELGLMHITRADRVTVDGWRTLDLSTTRVPDLTRVVDVGWADATDMVLLAASSADQPLTVYRISNDGYDSTSIGGSPSWDAVSLTVLLRTGAAVVLARNGQVFRNQGADWQPYLDKVSAVGFPG